ncbi:TPA: GGDEF domain-containing protein, partial [Escherichia coli]
MSRINKFVLTVSLLIFIMISAVACGIYTQMVKERVYGLKQSVIDTAFAVANIAEYRRSVAIDLINTLNPTEEQLLVGLRTAYADSVSPSYLYDVGPYLISSDECIQVKEFEKNYCADIMQVVKYRHVKNTGFISFDGKTFVYYLYPVTHNRSLIFLLGLERFSLLSKSLAMDSENL